MRKFLATFFAICMFATIVGASPTSDEARKALVTVAELGRVVDGGPVAGEERLVVGELRGRLSKHQVVPLGLRIPEPPQILFSFWGIDEHNNVLIGMDGFFEFVPANPVRFSVNGTRASRDVGVQTVPVANVGSPYDVFGNATAEFHAIALHLPGRLGVYNIEAEADWRPEFYFGVDYRHEVVPLGAILYLCTSADKVSMLFVFDTFDGKFPSTPLFTVNDEPLISVEPIVIGSIEDAPFITTTLVVVSKDTYQKLWESREGGVSVVVAGSDGVTIEWQDYIPPLEVLGECESTSTPTSTLTP
ncbi:hypothetical protein HYW73_01985 [Candidatus Nomurabacteria bacterium]|nr:hypothetical protein [Candidatus Nomurabacteria bacterium]